MKTADFCKKHSFMLCFFLIIILKFILSLLFSSDYQEKLFIPFVQEWIINGGNPYDHFADTQMFPYPPLMLFIESIGGLLAYLCRSNKILATALFKTPLFIFDIVCFVFLTKLFSKKKWQITVIYFCSPILLYSAYMHGQLDIIPTALLIGSIYFLLSRQKYRDALSSFFLSAALCTKFHILAILPIFFLFLQKRDGLKKALLYAVFIPICITAVLVIPFWCDGFLHNVLLNKEQSVLTRIALDFSSLKIYIPILAVLLIYLRMSVISRMNDELFFGFSTILFSVFLILVPPMPGWYVWILPFLVVFYIDIRSNRQINFLIFSLLNLIYILYFIFAHKTEYTDLYLLNKSLDFLKIQDATIKNILFTALFAVHAYIIYYIYNTALKGNILYNRQNASFVIGISGDSGSGKSTLIKIFESIFGEKQILTIECDGDHKWNRSSENWQKYTHLNPIANFLYRQAKDIAQLKEGKSVFRTEYNHETGCFSEAHKVLPKPYILVTGLHSLYLPQLRQQEDLKIYMDIDEKLRRFWKIQRDVYERAHSVEDVMAQIESRMDDFHKYIEPQKQYADLLISYFDKNLVDYKKEYIPHLSLKITAVVETNFELLASELSEYGIKVTYEFNEDMTYQSLTLESDDFEENTLPLMQIARNVVPRLEYLLNQPIVTRNNMWGIIGIVILVMIDERMNGKCTKQ